MRLEAYTGAGETAEGVFQIVAGADVLGRYRLYEGGFLCQAADNVWEPGYAGCAGVAGLAPRLDLLHFDFLAVLGARHWHGVEGRTLFGSDPGGSATVPFAGLRGGVSLDLEIFLVSVWLGFDDDLEREHVSYTYAGDDGSSARGEADVGTATFFAAIRAGAEFEWL